MDEHEALTEAMADIVTHSHLFKSLDDEGRREILASGYARSFAAGDVVVRQDDAGHDATEMFLVLEGEVRVETQTAGGKVHLAQLGRGACVGEVSVLSGGPRTATVTAVGDVETAAFARHRIQRVLARYPAVAALLQSVVESRAQDTIAKILAD